MRNLTYLIMSVLLATFALVFAAKMATAQDLAKVAPEDVKILRFAQDGIFSVY